MTSETSPFAQRLQALADKARSVTAFAAQCGVPQRTMHSWVKGEREPRVSDIALISERTGVSLEWLVSGKGLMQLTDAANPEARGSTAACTTSSGDVSDQPLPLNQEVLESVITGLELALQQLGKTLDPEEKARVVTTLYSISLRRHTIRMSGGTPLHVDKEFDAGNMSADVADLLRLIAESVRKKR